MAGRPKIFDSGEVITKAREVFRKKGYEATSTADLVNAMGIGKGSLYQEFKGGKREIFEKSICQFTDKLQERFQARLKASDTPLEELRNIFREIALAPVSAHLVGCFTGNTLVEMAGIDEELKELASGYLKGAEQIFYTALRRAQEMGQLSMDEDPELLAKSLLTLWNGINLTRRMYPQREVLAPIIEKMLEMLP